jgi:hypothetical protein
MSGISYSYTIQEQDKQLLPYMPTTSQIKYTTQSVVIIITKPPIPNICNIASHFYNNNVQKTDTAL